MNIYVIYQPEAQDVRDISGHIRDYLDHRYGRAHVSGTGSAGDAQAHMSALARANVVIALIGPSWQSVADERVEGELAQAQAQRKMIVPTLLGGAHVPTPRTPAEAALLTHQVMTVRPDPDMAQDLNRLFGEVNTQLGWAPMSGGLLVAGLLFAGLDALFLAFIYGDIEISGADPVTLAYDIFNPLQPALILLLGVALWQAIRRRTWVWGAIMSVGGATSLSEAVNVVVGFLAIGWLNRLILFVFPVALVAFALFGPRRELQRLYPPRMYRSA